MPPADFRLRLSRSLTSGLDIIQFREKRVADSDRHAWLQLLLAQRVGERPLVVINARFDIGVACGADGVHLPSNSLPIASVRACVGRDFLIGKSTHNLVEAVEAERCGADYIFFGPVFDTPAKRVWGPPQGLAALKEVCRTVSIPVFAIGGITPQNSAAACAQGARGLAGTGWFQQALDMSSAVSALRASVG